MEHERTFTVVSPGEVCWDMLPDGKRFGGAPVNFAYHARVLGAEAFVASCVGRDDLGKEAFARLGELGLTRRCLDIDPEHPTGTVDVETDADGRHSFTIHEDVAWDYLHGTPELFDLALNVDAVCFGSLCQRSPTSQETIIQFLSTTGDECLWVFDANLRQPFYNEEVIRASVEAAHVLRLSAEELQIVAELLEVEGGEEEALAGLMEDYSLDLIALTRGAEGSLLVRAEEKSSHPGFEVEVADVAGAGDAFTAVLVMGLLSGKDLDTVNEQANRLASYVCSQQGATPEIPPEIAAV